MKTATRTPEPSINTAATSEQALPSAKSASKISKSLKAIKQSFFVQNFEDLFRVVSYFIIGLFMFFINGLLQFREYAEAHTIQTIPWAWNCLSIIIVFSLFGLKYLIRATCWDWCMENISETYTGEARTARGKKILKWIYDTVYYSTTTVFSLLAFRQSSFMPSVFGGSGECSGILSSYPAFPTGSDADYVLLYHLVQFGSHVFSFIELVFIRRKEEQKFYEYTLHHFMAAGLIFYSGMFNFIYVSVLVLIIHDMGDIIVAGGRAYADMKFKSKYVLYTIMGIALLVWIGTRIVIFPSCIIYTCWQNFSNPSWGVWDMIKYAYYYQFIQLIILFFMHCYWTLFMLKIVFTYAVKPKYNNAYDNLDFKRQQLQQQQQQQAKKEQ